MQFFHVYIFSEPAQRALLLLGKVCDGAALLGAAISKVAGGLDEFPTGGGGDEQGR